MVLSYRVGTTDVSPWGDGFSKTSLGRLRVVFLPRGKSSDTGEKNDYSRTGTSPAIVLSVSLQGGVKGRSERRVIGGGPALKDRFSLIYSSLKRSFVTVTMSGWVKAPGVVKTSNSVALPRETEVVLGTPYTLRSIT